MHTERRLIFAVIAGAVLATLLLAVVGMLLVDADRPAGPDKQFEYPIEWQESRQPGNASAETARLVLREDGSADVSGIALGAIAGEGGDLCVRASDVERNGSGTWKLESEGRLRITVGERAGIFIADAGRFSGWDWSELRQTFCDGKYVDFSPIN